MKPFSRIFAAFLVLMSAALVLAQSTDYEAIANNLVANLVARQFDKVEAQFDSQMQAALPVTKLPEVWDSILAQTGAFKAVTTSKVMQKQGLVAAILTCEFEHATLEAKVFMDAKGQVKGLFFEPPSDSAETAAAQAEWQAP